MSNKDKVSICLVEEEDVEILSIDGLDIIKIHVSEAPKEHKPVFINGDITKSYMRGDSGDYLLSEEHIRSFINDKTSTRFDQRPNRLNVRFEDLDQESVESFIRVLTKTGKLPIVADLSPVTILERIGAYAKDKKTNEYALTNGAVLFLSKTVDIRSLCPDLWLDYTYCGSESRWDKRLTNRDLIFEGNIFQFYLHVLNSLVDYAPSPYVLDGVQDTGKAIVEAMLREAFANAISNLDLFDQAGLRISQNKTEISFTNAGTMLVPLEDAILGGNPTPGTQRFSLFSKP